VSHAAGVAPRLARNDGDVEAAGALARRAVEVRRAFETTEAPYLLYAEAVSEQSLGKLRDALDAGFHFYHVDIDADLISPRDDPELSELLAEHDPRTDS
jgi:hypothetical protein